MWQMLLREDHRKDLGDQRELRRAAIEEKLSELGYEREVEFLRPAMVDMTLRELDHGFTKIKGKALLAAERCSQDRCMTFSCRCERQQRPHGPPVEQYASTGRDRRLYARRNPAQADPSGVDGGSSCSRCRTRQTPPSRGVCWIFRGSTSCRPPQLRGFSRGTRATPRGGRGVSLPICNSASYQRYCRTLLPRTPSPTPSPNSRVSSLS
jgi:hypothetical protein